MGQGKKEERKGKQNGVKEGDEEKEGVMDEQRRWTEKKAKSKGKQLRASTLTLKLPWWLRW